MTKNRIRLTESQLHRVIKESVKNVLNEISQQTKAKSFVRGNNAMQDLQRRKANGEKAFMKNGRYVDVDNELSRKRRQMDTFGQGLARDLSMENPVNREQNQRTIDHINSEIQYYQQVIQDAPNSFYDDRLRGIIRNCQEKIAQLQDELKNVQNNTYGYSVSHDNGTYRIDTPTGHVYSDTHSNGAIYDKQHSNTSNVNRMYGLRGVTDAMMGYDDELNGRIDKEVDGYRRRQRNVQKSQDYRAAKSEWDKQNRAAQDAQRRYDKMSPLNPKKWFTRRPADAPQQPTAPQWETGEDGQFDGYFAHENPQDYNRDIENARTRQSQYRNAKDKYFG